MAPVASLWLWHCLSVTNKVGEMRAERSRWFGHDRRLYWPSLACRERRWPGDQRPGPARWRTCRRCACTRRPLARNIVQRPRHRRPRQAAPGHRPRTLTASGRRRPRRPCRPDIGGRVWRPSACARPPRWTARRPARTGRCVGRTMERARRTSRTCTADVSILAISVSFSYYFANSSQIGKIKVGEAANKECSGPRPVPKLSVVKSFLFFFASWFERW